MTILQAQKWANNIEIKLSDQHKAIAKPIIKEISLRLTFLVDVGLDYLTLNRKSNTLATIDEAFRVQILVEEILSKT